MSGRHVNPARIHPECLTFGSTTEPCICDDLFGYSADGECNRTRAILIAERMEARTGQVVRGRGPDSDELADNERDGRRSTIYSENALWKRSEFLKCNRGDDLVCDDRGLPPGYMDERS